MPALRKPLLIALLAALAALAAGCWNDDDDDAAPAPAASYTVTITGADIVNKDSGAAVDVGGMPLEGGVLTLE